MNIVDSSGWLEILANGKHAETFLEVIESPGLVVPSITIFEVTKRARALGTEAQAQRIEVHMRRVEVVDLTADRASAAAVISFQHKLPMADSIIYAVALEFNAILWTMDADFKGLPLVRHVAKSPDA